MNYRKLGKTDLNISEIGFGAWGIGGPAMAGKTPIGWGDVNDEESTKAILKSYELGVNFFDTADFYGLGHSETLLGKVLSPYWKDVFVATKVGHQLKRDGTIKLNYTKSHITKACEASLKRLNKEVIDLYQLHSAKLEHLEKGDCVEAMMRLKEAGKIRYWGISLNTFNPEPEAEFMIKNRIGDSFQLVFNVINQRAAKTVIPDAFDNGYGIIARMPLQFGLLAGKYEADKVFPQNDHRSFRLSPDLLTKSLDVLDFVWDVAHKYKVSRAELAISFILNNPQITTTICGIKTEEQAIENIKPPVELALIDIRLLTKFFDTTLSHLVDEYQAAE